MSVTSFSLYHHKSQQYESDTMNDAGDKVIVSPAKLHSFSCILGHLLNIKAIEAFQIIILFGLNMSCQTRMCFKLKDITLALTHIAEMLIISN